MITKLNESKSSGFDTEGFYPELDKSDVIAIVSTSGL